MSARPPGRVSLLWCPVCGRDDRITDLKKGAGRHFSGGMKCPGEPQELNYVLPAAPEPLPGAGEGTYRAAVAVEVAIRPVPPHLGEQSHRATFVGHRVMVHANTVEELALLVEASADLLTRQVGDGLAVHPRPAPPMGWPR